MRKTIKPRILRSFPNREVAEAHEADDVAHVVIKRSKVQTNGPLVGSLDYDILYLGQERVRVIGTRQLWDQATEARFRVQDKLTEAKKSGTIYEPGF